MSKILISLLGSIHDEKVLLPEKIAVAAIFCL